MCDPGPTIVCARIQMASFSEPGEKNFFFGTYHKILHAFNQVLFQLILAAIEEQEENTAARDQGFILSFNSMSKKQSNSM